MYAKKSKGNQINQRGGKRTGAGRPSGRKNKATAEQKMTLEELARTHTDTALAVLVEVAQHGQSEAARVSAANAILDRGFGKPRYLEPESLPKVAPAESYADAMAEIDAEFNELLEGSLLTFSAKKEPPQPDRRPAKPDPQPRWTIGWDG